MSSHWLDLVDPTRDELLAVLPSSIDPAIVDALAAPARVDREPRPQLEGHETYVYGVLAAMLARAEGRGAWYQEIFLVATPERLVTVCKTPDLRAPFDVSALQAAAEPDTPVGVLLHHLAEDVADSYLDLLDAIYAAIDDLEDRLDELRPAQVRLRLSELRHELLHRRRAVSATRAAVRRVLDGRVEVGGALFPPEVERLFGDTYDTLVRVTEELDVARDLLASVRDHLQAKIAESQNEVGKKLTVIASLVLVPSLVVGFFGQNFEGEFGKGFWTLGVSTALILGSTVVQLVLFRWRRWI